MFEDIIGTPKKQICELCRAENLEIVDKLPELPFRAEKPGRFIKCSTCDLYIKIEVGGK